MIQLYMGDGKGKTTAAVGQAVRAAGCGEKVVFSQFMKGNETGELNILKSLPQLEILRSPKNFGFYSSMSKEDKKELTSIHNDILDRMLQKVRENAAFLIVMDEITYPVKWELLDLDRLNKILEICGDKAFNGHVFMNQSGTMEQSGLTVQRRTGRVEDSVEENFRKKSIPELILTGRDPADFLVHCADYVTEMKKVRHPFDLGVTARKGIEY